MASYYKNNLPWISTPFPEEPQEKPKKKKGKKCSLAVLFSVLFIAVGITIILTYTLASAVTREKYVSDLQKKQEEILRLETALGATNSSALDLNEIAFVEWMFQQLSYYDGTLTAEEQLDTLIKAYVGTTGDAYASYYNAQEYAAFLEERRGRGEGIGISAEKSEIRLHGVLHQSFRVAYLHRDTPAEQAGILPGDHIVALKVDGVFKDIASLGGYDAAATLFHRETGETLDLLLYRKNGTEYERVESTVVCDTYEFISVAHAFSQTDPTVGILRIYRFDFTTPIQFKAEMKALIDGGAEKIVFDLRANPGGDLQSVKAVLSLLLNEGDLIMTTVDRSGGVKEFHYAGPIDMAGDYAACNVKKEEVGMYGGYEMAVLCNAQTASFAEVFASTLRDHGKATLVGEKTYGKGVLQSYYNVAAVSGGLYEGYLKLTTHELITKNGASYHNVGILPDVFVLLSEEAYDYGVFSIPEELDTQLLSAIELLTNSNQ